MVGKINPNPTNWNRGSYPEVVLEVHLDLWKNVVLHQNVDKYWAMTINYFPLTCTAIWRTLDLPVLFDILLLYHLYWEY